MRNHKRDIIVGAFVAAALIIFAWATIRVSDRTTVSGSGYEIGVLLENATGLKNKAPVLLAGVQIGVVKDIELVNSRFAKAILLIDKKVKLPEDTEAILRTRGFLGETYVEIVPGQLVDQTLKPGDDILSSRRTGDINQLVSQFSDIANDIKAVTESFKDMSAGENAPVRKAVDDLQEFSQVLKEIMLRNEANFDRISSNLAEVSGHLRVMIEQSRQNVEEAMAHISSISGKVDRGEGTLGRLVNDEETVEKLNEAIDNLNESLGGFRKLEAEIGYHAEYLTQSEDFKHYVSLGLKPKPDQAFLLDIVGDPNPPPRFVQKTTDITAGGTTSQVSTNTATIKHDSILISAQLAKRIYDFWLRGGLIESTGGVGLDYVFGPMQASFSAYDFSTDFGRKPHLKAWSQVNLTKNFYLMGGADDIINPDQDPDYFVGAGFRLVDDDIKSLFSLGKVAR